MGADGGINIIKTEEIRENWLDIKSGVKKIYDRYFEKIGYYKKIYKKEYENALKLPNDINSLSSEEICKLLQGVMMYYDTPYLIKDLIIVGYGTNIDDIANDLFDLLPESNCVETWS